MNEINLVCLPNHTSYGIVSTNIIKQLVKLGVKVNLFPIHQQGIEAYPEDHELLRSCIQNAQLCDYYAPSVRIWHQFDLAMHAGCGARFGFPIFELDKFNDLEKHHLQNQDRLLVCSHWAKNVILDNDINLPIHVVPLGVDTDTFHPNYHVSYSKTDTKNTSFYTVGKKELRKGYDFILKCFEKAFCPSDNVELHILWENRILKQSRPDEDRSWDDFYSRSKLASKIKTDYGWLPDQRSVASKICNLDCGLFVSRAEGWNLGLLEALAMGKPVIATNYSAHTEFISKDNAMLIPVDETEPATDGVWFHGQGNWATLGRDQEDICIEYMLDIHHRKQYGKEILFNSAGMETVKKFSWENTAKSLLEAIS